MSAAPSISSPAAGPGRGASAESVIRGAGLPEAIGRLVLDIADRTRLWKRERADVAMELCDHFRGGLEAGLAEADLIREFGEPREAAALIRQARRRLRPLWWHAWRRTVQSAGLLIGGCILVYAVLLARFLSGAPDIKHNYMEEMNAVTLAVPVEQRAWPRYLDALRSFAPVPEEILRADVPAGPGDAHWAEYSAWVRSHPDGLRSIREAAARPTLGYLYSSDVDPELIEIMKIGSPGYRHIPGPDVENPLAIGILLPHLGELRKMARWMSVDAVDGALCRDSARFIADLEAMLGMADQCLAGPQFITQQVGLAIFEYARRTAQPHLADEGLLSEDQLARLSHAFIAGPRARLRLDVAGEATIIDDVLQRFYTDDGRGSGRFIRSPELSKMYEDFGVARPKGEPVLAAFRPIQSVLLPSRGELNDMKRQFLARAGADEAMPPWRHDERTSDEIYRRIGESGLYQIMPIIESLMDVRKSRPMAMAFGTRDLVLAQRDAMLVIIALEIHRRRHGEYPAMLEALSPGLLPRVPPDPMDGRPLRYRPPSEAGGRPVLYSVGADGVDDGGVPPQSAIGRRVTAELQPSFLDYRRPRSELSGEQQRRLELGRGDWVLWPEPPAAPQP